MSITNTGVHDLADAIRAVASALERKPAPGPCPSAHELHLAWAGDDWRKSRIVSCELRAGHAGDHEWHDVNGETYARWTGVPS